MHIIKEKANAKINLYLDVTALREDGFHDIKSVMHSVSLYDEISIKYTPSSKTSIRVSVSGNKFLPTDEKNLAYRAAQLFLNRAALNANIEIIILKRIPVAAGLAGGSSDAAAVFRGMNKIFGRMFSERALSDMSAELGSDIPFCLYGKTALCEGRGEIMTRIKTYPKLKLVIAVANEYMSTPTAYKRLDELYRSFDGSINSGGEEYFERLMISLAQNGVSENSLFNIFENSVFPICQGAAKIKAELIDMGAYAALMSGSGPSVFGIFKSEDDAVRALNAMKARHITAFYAESVN